MPRRRPTKWSPLVDESLPEAYRENARQLQNRLAELGFANPINAFIQQPDGKLKLKPLNKIPKDTLNLIREIVDTPQGQIIKFNNPVPALNILARTLGMQTKRIEIVEKRKIELEEDEEIQRLLAKYNEDKAREKAEQEQMTIDAEEVEDE